MESVISLIVNAENVRMLVLLMSGLCGYMLLKTSLEKKIGGVESSLLKAMDEKIAAANQSLYAQLKANDFKHLNDTIEALTFTLEKNQFLTREDKEYIDGRLNS